MRARHKMLGFMDYVQGAFYESTQWNRNNSYGSLTDTARGKPLTPPSSRTSSRVFRSHNLIIYFSALLEFPTPHGLRFNVSSLSSPNFATSYTLGSVGFVDGSLSYLYSSTPLTKVFKSSQIPLRALVPGYRHLQNLRQPDESWLWEIWQQGKRIDRRGKEQAMMTSFAAFVHCLVFFFFSSFSIDLRRTSLILYSPT